MVDIVLDRIQTKFHRLSRFKSRVDIVLERMQTKFHLGELFVRLFALVSHLAQVFVRVLGLVALLADIGDAAQAGL